jgi:hypothetical protein
MSSKPMDLVCFLYMPLGSGIAGMAGIAGMTVTGQLPTGILGVSLVSHHRKPKKWLNWKIELGYDIITARV